SLVFSHTLVVAGEGVSNFAEIGLILEERRIDRTLERKRSCEIPNSALIQKRVRFVVHSQARISHNFQHSKKRFVLFIQELEFGVVRTDRLAMIGVTKCSQWTPG